ncbi:acid protease [Mycena vulgaris]|nr:acid protease [Mycena vulgaris]
MPNKSIGVVQTTNTDLGGIPGVDGILGIGPEELSVGTLEINATLGVPTIVQTLSCQMNITAQLFDIALQPTTGVMSLNGEISRGAVDTTKFTGPVVFSPIASQEPSSSFSSTDMTFSYGAISLFGGSVPGIIDTCSTLIYLATDAYSRYLMLTGATLDPVTNFLTVPSISNLQNLVFTMSGIYLVIANVGTPSGVGLDFILGITFLQRFYSVYDYANALFGLAVTPFTNATSN